MTSRIKSLYRQFRKAGYTSTHALSAAKTLARWRDCEYSGSDREDSAPESPGDAESEGWLRLRAVPEDDHPFQVWGEPEEYVNVHGRRVSAEEAKTEALRLIELYGLWIVVSELWNPLTQKWEEVASIGMNEGYQDVLSPFENWYVPDLMQSAIEAAEEAWTQYEARRELLAEIASLD